MYAHVYTLDGGFYYDNFGIVNYLKCEYLREPLKWIERVLKPLSSFMKGEIDEVLLCRAYHYILQEEDMEMERRFFSREYTTEGLDAAGLSELKDK